MNNHVGREQIINVGGKDYKLSRLRRKEWSAFHAWAEALLPNVLDVLASNIEKYPANLQPIMASEAVQLVNEPIERRTSVLIDTPSGWAKIVHLLLQENHLDVTEDEAWDVAVAIKQEMWDVIARAEGRAEGNGPGEAAGSQVGQESTATSPENTN